MHNSTSQLLRVYEIIIIICNHHTGNSESVIVIDNQISTTTIPSNLKKKLAANIACEQVSNSTFFLTPQIELKQACKQLSARQIGQVQQ